MPIGSYGVSFFLNSSIEINSIAVEKNLIIVIAMVSRIAMNKGMY
ncbi:hypothetical protein ABIC12_003509 [Pantoea agglomerans]|jgi:hypothetical protein